MIPTIHLYHKAVMTRNEIYDVVSYYVLPEELNP